MKRILLPLVFLIAGTQAFGQQPDERLPVKLSKPDEATEPRQSGVFQVPAPEAVIWEEDFANGIPAGWTNQGFDGNLQPLSAARWEYRGPTTTPNAGTGSRGAYATANTPIRSQTRSNGFVIFDSDYLDNGGSTTGGGSGSAPSPHVGTLTTDTIDLSNKQFVMLTISSLGRLFRANMQIAFSNDGGVTWNDSITVYDRTILPINDLSPNPDNHSYDISSYVGGAQNAMIRFIFDGRPGSANTGYGYYYWCLDDLIISDLPKHSLRFVDNSDGAPAHDIIYDSGEKGKYGRMTLKQVRPISFDSNILNFGTSTQNNVRLELTILDANNNVLQTLTSPAQSIAYSAIADYNTIVTPSWTPTAVGDYKIVYTALSDSVNDVVAIAPRDTFLISVTDSVMSLDFNTFDNQIGVNNIGDDGGSIGSRFDLSQDERLFGVELGLSTANGGTVAGAIVEVSVYDTTGFTLRNGFPTTPVAYATDTVTTAHISSRSMRLNMRTPDGHPIYLNGTTPGSYYIVVTMYSNGGRQDIHLRNSTAFIQPSFASILYGPADRRWYTGFLDSDILNAPHIRAITCPASNAAACMQISIQEIDISGEIQVYPNPAREYVHLQFGDISGAVDIRITDIQGRQILQKAGVAVPNSEIPVDLSALKPGVYVMTVHRGETFGSFRLTVQ